MALQAQAVNDMTDCINSIQQVRQKDEQNTLGDLEVALWMVDRISAYVGMTQDSETRRVANLEPSVSCRRC